MFFVILLITIYCKGYYVVFIGACVIQSAVSNIRVSWDAAIICLKCEQLYNTSSPPDLFVSFDKIVFVGIRSHNFMYYCMIL